MAIRHGRGRLLRVVVALAAIAVPAISVGTANAAIAGGAIFASRSTPDLVSATITGPAQVQVCFDKAITLTGSSPGGAAGYRSGNFTPAASANGVPSNGQCFNAAFNPSTNGELTQKSIYTVPSGAVAITTGQPNAGSLNIADSIPLTGSSTHAGTTGVATPPNLTGVTAPGTSTTPNALQFVFDQALDPANTSTGFHFITAAGNTCDATGTPVVSGNMVTATFNANQFLLVPGECSTANAQRVYVDQASVTGFADHQTSYGPQSGVGFGLVPGGASGQTNLPTLTGATLSASGTQVTYTYDRTLNPSELLYISLFNATAASQFTAVLSDGAQETATSVAQASATSLVVSFPQRLSQEYEYGVIATAGPNVFGGTPLAATPIGTVVGNTIGGVIPNPSPVGTATSVAGSAPIGDNANAFSRAYTTGPDVFSVGFDRPSGQGTITVDQRVASALNSGGQFTGGVELLDYNGTALAPCFVTVPLINTAAPGAEALKFNCNFFFNSALGFPTAAAVAFDSFGGSGTTNPTAGNCALETGLQAPGSTPAVGSPNDRCSVPQIVAITGTAAHIHAVRTVSHKTKKHSKHIKKHSKHIKKHTKRV